MFDSLGDRMKRYEDVNRYHLYPRMPIVIRIDGRAFHTFTKGFEKPFDFTLKNAFQYTLLSLTKELSEAKIGYTQSDEISLFIHIYNRFDTEAIFNGNIQKISSNVASLATVYFNKFLSSEKFGTFDCRCFNLPKEEIYNYFLWRQRDCIRNSISSYARHLLGHKACLKKKTGELLNLIPKEKWDTVNKAFKYGSLILKPSDTFIYKNIQECKDEIENLVIYQEEK